MYTKPKAKYVLVKVAGNVHFPVFGGSLHESVYFMSRGITLYKYIHHVTILPKRKSFLLEISESLAIACRECTYFKAESEKSFLVVYILYSYIQTG